MLAAAAGVALMAIAAFMISILQGAGRELGRVGLAESAPWIARVLPRLGLRVLRIGLPGADDLEAELDSLVEREFKGRRSVPGRARALLTVLKESVGILRQAREIREAPVIPSLPSAKPLTPKPSEIDWEALGWPRIPDIHTRPLSVSAFDDRTLQAMSSAIESLRAPADEVAKMLAAFDANRFARSLDFTNSPRMLSSVNSLARSLDFMNSPGMLAAVDSLERHFRGRR